MTTTPHAPAAAPRAEVRPGARLAVVARPEPSAAPPAGPPRDASAPDARPSYWTPERCARILAAGQQQLAIVFDDPRLKPTRFTVDILGPAGAVAMNNLPVRIDPNAGTPGAWAWVLLAGVLILAWALPAGAAARRKAQAHRAPAAGADEGDDPGRGARPRVVGTGQL